MKRQRRVTVFYKQVILVLLINLMGLWITTQLVAHLAEYQTQLGQPLTLIFGMKLYRPWDWVIWSYYFHYYSPLTFTHIPTIAHTICFFLSLALVITLAIKRTRNMSAREQTRWANENDMKKAGLLRSGVVLVQADKAEYEFKQIVKRNSDGETEYKDYWDMKKTGRLLRHDGPEHVMVFAPTRSGKGVGVVIPTLLTWPHSVVVLDIKKENYNISAGFRASFSDVICLDITSRESVGFNPLAEIKIEDVISDAQSMAQILVDPNGTKEELSHWDRAASTLLTAAIVHLVETDHHPTLPGVLKMLTDPDKDKYKLLEEWLNNGSEFVKRAARDNLNKSANELSGVFSTATGYLGLMHDPIIAANLSKEGFRISDLMNDEKPKSLYLIVPPKDISRISSLLRVIISQIVQVVTGRMGTGGPSYKHRLLLLLDELTSLGNLEQLEKGIAYFAGYGVKCTLICQSLNQLAKYYGHDNSLMDNCLIRLTYGSTSKDTAAKISELCGEREVSQVSHNYSGSRIAPWLSNVMATEQLKNEPLISYTEVLNLPYTDAILLVGNSFPIRAKKIMFYQDERFKNRANLSLPEFEPLTIDAISHAKPEATLTDTESATATAEEKENTVEYDLADDLFEEEAVEVEPDLSQDDEQEASSNDEKEKSINMDEDFGLPL